ncbi:hypothetical protein [Cellulomonas fimi]|uniref:Uncharacterized protein n=1 Tax=Cellulomonas fimi TaxID=1708 RepID=A0A7Y0LYB6_CELFI|nr:hypothetical protein [Cellulomonas fimi]NMR20487.1 hypothetical protein [Cellulomonas fimi]
MTTQTLTSRATPTRRTVGDVVRWYRETPAPRWEGSAAGKARFVQYLVVSGVAWIAVGVLGSALVNRLVQGIAAVAG